ncbi:Monofunctional biosynthetic peptidoglycan transglycosylase [hydrothermal vent metagenome]|uniref:Monofunctional biosynthetic peptidoglycan transglycosylase n=1 Tax=hydrothermal vent metagenome TaxID=652676 RepID=A0A3B1CT24_9ZZZZ
MKKFIYGILIFFTAYTLYTSVILMLFIWIDPPTTAFIQQNKEPSFESILKKNNIMQTWISLDRISNEVKIAILTSEDQLFLDHWGFDVAQIQKVVEDIGKGKRVRGASTITQQVAKNLFLFPNKLWFRKILESYYTVLIELIWSKRRIMEVYLNIAEFGKNIYGVEAASSFYFKKSSSYLNSLEGAMLAAILPNPIRYNVKHPSVYLKKRINRIQQESKNLDKKKIIKELD